MRTTTKHLEVGKWRLGVSTAEEVTAVRLKGMRNRSHPLSPVPKAEFMARLTKRPNGEILDPAILRGVPNSYLQEGPHLMLWPSPAHQWTIEIDSRPRAK